ncbi:MAG: hypothetical protein OSJ28_08305 [Desulfovibrio sp.]|jgi:uncharacterized protein with PIN domain|nr:hypothetical protein [Desulfovibrio sp.]
METAQTSDGRPDAQSRKVCKRCGKPIRTEFAFCSLCRKRLLDVEKKRQMDDLAEMQATRTAAKRHCHDCGKPTTNYRCEACWERLRKKHGVPADGDVNVAEGWE